MKTRWKPNTLELTYIIVTFLISSSLCCEENGDLRCKSGECLTKEKVCDGISDCPDGSDETADTCLQTTCLPFFFRCTYGACVPKEAQCNGKMECADGSDEADELCKPDSSSQNSICSTQEFQCDSGACINQQDACNGQIDCPDQSDETIKACSANFCPAPYFRCGYGACINAVNKCDGHADCHDSTDETFCDMNFVQNTTPTTASTIPTRDTITTPTFIFPDSTVTSKSSCIAPSIENSQLVYLHDPSQVLEPGMEIPNGAQIMYNCKRRYHREGQESSLCLNGNWYPSKHPICTRYCPGNVLNGVTFTSICMFEATRVDCNDRIKPGTYATTNCRFKYRVPAHSPPQTLFCQEDGEWDFSPSRCESVCGEELVESVPFAVNGVVTNITAVPWHVAIYKLNKGQYEHTCGGTILNAKVVITAAHCFWDNANEGLDNKALYLVGAGKTLRDYRDAEPRAAQFRNISRIAVPDEFQGANNNFKADIAVLVLTDALTFSTFISPICIRWETGGAKALTSDTLGQIAGWGKDETGRLSSELKTTHVPMSSYEVCRREAEPRLANSITDDKFCVLNKYNQNVCEGDSGGGFVVKKKSGSKYRHYLWGIVSNGVPIKASCNEYQFVNYVNIQYYETFISFIQIKNRPK